VAIILLAVEIGFHIGIRRTRKFENERQAPIDAMVGSTLGLLAFMLAFTFGMATSRYEARKQQLLDDVIAIRTVDLRAQLLPEPHRSAIRALLREYVDIRVEVSRAPGELAQGIAHSEELHDQLWSHAVALGPDLTATPFTVSYMQALIQMMDVHSKRLTASVHNRIPGEIWLALYCVAVLAMAITGYRTGIVERRSVIATLIVVLAFSVVIVVIADLDRPQEGFLKISQQSMLDLQTRLHRP
jgi:hypothetical protein